jgi:hypothetical protein
MQRQMERLMFESEEFRGQQELDSEDAKNLLLRRMEVDY